MYVCTTDVCDNNASQLHNTTYNKSFLKSNNLDRHTFIFTKRFWIGTHLKGKSISIDCMQEGAALKWSAKFTLSDEWLNNTRCTYVTFVKLKLILETVTCRTGREVAALPPQHKSVVKANYSLDIISLPSVSWPRRHHGTTKQIRASVGFTSSSSHSSPPVPPVSLPLPFPLASH